MTRLTRLVNPFSPPESSLLLTGRNPHLNPTVVSQLVSSARRRLSCTRRREFSDLPLSHSLAPGRRKMDSTIEANSLENLSGSAIDDFVTVENPANEGSPRAEPSTPNPNFDPVEGDERLDDVVVGSESSRRVGGDRNSGMESEDSERRELPEELARSLVVLSCENSEGGTCDVYLVGTAHVSQESCREVQAVISCLKPQVVFLELCPSRVAILTLKDLKVPTMSEMIDMWKKKQNIFGILYSWFLAKVADKLEVLPGSEFRVAFEEAMKYGGKVILGDRPVQVTLRRTWGKMPLWHKTKLLYSLFFQAVFLPSPEDLNRMLKEMDDIDMLTLVIQEMSKEFPTLMETLVNERDQYMSSTLLKVASEHTSVVAVVGKGHVQGIQRQWKQPVEINELLETPSRSPILSAVNILATVGAVLAGAAIISGIYIASKKQS